MSLSGRKTHLDRYRYTRKEPLSAMNTKDGFIFRLLKIKTRFCQCSLRLVLSPGRRTAVAMENALVTMSSNDTTEDYTYDVKVLAKSYTIFKISM